MSCPGVQSPCSDSASSPLYPSKPVSFFTKTSKHFPSNKQKKKKKWLELVLRPFLLQKFFSVLVRMCKKIGELKIRCVSKYNQTCKKHVWIFGTLIH